MASLGVQHVSAHRLELFMRKEGIRVIELQGVKGLEDEPVDSGEAGATRGAAKGGAGSKHDDLAEDQEQKEEGSEAAKGPSMGQAPAIARGSDGKAAARSPARSVAAEHLAGAAHSTSQPK